MQHSSRKEVVILKPSSVFLSFLSAQAPDADLPELAQLQVDTTAYTISKQESEEETLDEIERHFPTMFHYEISRWLGDGARHDIEGSFLDFLCCFKFEMHSNIVLMEPSFKEAHQLLCVKPRSVLLKWIKSAVDGSKERGDLIEVIERISLTQLSENATVVVKNFEQRTDVLPFVQKHYKSLLKSEIQRVMQYSQQELEVRSFEDFTRYFSVEVHNQLVYLS